MANLAEGLVDELRRVRAIEQLYKELRGGIGVNVEPALSLMRHAIEAAEAAQGSGDVVEMIRCYQRLKEFEA